MISVIVPVYNEEKHIGRCINSVLAQTYSDFELLLVDDGSMDMSGAICDEYANKDKRVKVFHKQNGGVSTARNFGIAKCSGKYVMFLDSDDYLLPNALEILYSGILHYATPISTANFYIERSKREIFCNGWRDGVVKDNFRAWYFNSLCLCAGTTLYHRDIIKDNMFNVALTRYEDVESLFEMIRSNKIAYQNKCVMVYSVGEPGLSAKCKDYKKDYIFHMNFNGKSFWEKMELGCKLNEGFAIYPECEQELYSKYKKYLIYAKLDCKIRRFKKYKRKIYRLLFKIE